MSSPLGVKDTFPNKRSLPIYFLLPCLRSTATARTAWPQPLIASACMFTSRKPPLITDHAVNGSKLNWPRPATGMQCICWSFITRNIPLERLRSDKARSAREHLSKHFRPYQPVKPIILISSLGTGPFYDRSFVALTVSSWLETCHLLSCNSTLRWNLIYLSSTVSLTYSLL